MNKLQTLIVDDEAPARENIQLLVEQYPFLELAGTCPDGRSAIAFIRKEKPDLVFLDIQMPEVSGFEVLRALAEEEMPYVIFTTAFDQYAIQAFEINAVDYLLKPFDDERFELAVQRAKAAHEDRLARHWNRQMKSLLETAGISKPARYLQKFSVKSGNRIRFVPVEEVLWIAAENQYVRLHTYSGNYLLRQSLNSLEDLLSPEDFYRVHRSSIVRISAIGQVEPYFKGDYIIYLEDGTKVKLSRNRSGGLRQRLPW